MSPKLPMVFDTHRACLRTRSFCPPFIDHASRGCYQCDSWVGFHDDSDLGAKGTRFRVPELGSDVTVWRLQSFRSVQRSVTGGLCCAPGWSETRLPSATCCPK